MDTKINSGTEVVIKVPDERGVLAKISSALSEAGINIQAICAYKVDEHAHMRIITENNEKAVTVLGDTGFEADEHDVVKCEISPSALHPDPTGMLGSYDVESNYWCASAHSGEHALLIFSPKNALRTANIR